VPQSGAQAKFYYSSLLTLNSHEAQRESKNLKKIYRREKKIYAQVILSVFLVTF
jgi:hypothetical protein